MFDLKHFYELILFLYGLSLVGYFIDFIQNNRKARMFAFWLLHFVWGSQIILFLMELFIHQHFPVGTLVDGLLFFVMLLITLSLILHYYVTGPFILFSLNVIGFLFLLLYLGAAANTHLPDSAIQLIDEVLIAHITLAFVSYAFFALSFTLSVIYLIQYHLLKKKKGLKWVWKLNELDVLDKYSFRSIGIGVPLLIVALLLGFGWANMAGEQFYWFDWKILGSLLVLAGYSVYLYLRIVRKYQGKFLARYTVFTFMFVLINFFLFSTISGFHI